ncbi:deoxyguanosinetriphosphate triphosphohydrolase-like protein [compost metagenome]
MGKSPLHGRENLSDPIQFCLLQQKLPPQQAKNLYIIYHIVMNIADYISGMTDSFAKDLYQKLVGATL